MAKKQKIEEEVEEIKSGSKNALDKILKENKSDHYNFIEAQTWKISTGSLLLDLALGGGIVPCLLRICGYNNEGKTPQTLEIVRNFLKDVPNSKCLWDVAEGRGLSKENKERCGLKFVYSPDEWEVGTVFVLESNIFELYIKIVKDLVKDNPDNIKYAFVVDSVDGLQLRDDAAKDIDGNNKVAGVPALSKKMMQSLSLGMFKYGHLMVLLSQVTSEIKIDPYAKTVNRGGQYSGGNSLNHAADFILMYQNTYDSDYILDNPKGKLKDGKSKSIGKYCKVALEKSAIEATRKTQIIYPIKFGKKPSGIWVEKEITDLLLAWNLITKAASGWLSFKPEIAAELKEIDPDLPEKIQGLDNLSDYFETKPELTTYLYNKFAKLLA